ncbi:exonuclease domain-containing protein [Psittacicella gerlachiana]|uniref:Exonuclease domain-containing protein n=1 Tax=Psittacicella gerlachiana TaxID=2028574 RepID=A0A3A1YEW0_9GAMM|nr:exonuclease domain-containing protein [Psittacicella gerlachiana]RIY36702.1 hypothetical protein CKF59_02535 [Psittacicella gerlachiana]
MILNNQDTGQTSNLDQEFSAEQIDKICNLAQTFDYDLFVNDHVNGIKEYNGHTFANYAQVTQLDKNNPVATQAAEYMAKRFRGFYPLVVDIETTGIDHHENSIIQIAAVALTFDQDLNLVPYAELKLNVHPLKGNSINPDSIAITKINPFNYQRKAVDLTTALTALCKFARGAQKAHGCKRTVLTAHNVNFDKGFIYHYLEKCKIKRIPFHPFTVFDTSVLGAMFLADSRLKIAINKLPNETFDSSKAHDALFDAHECAKLFAYCVNSSKDLVQPYLSEEIA